MRLALRLCPGLGLRQLGAVRLPAFCLRQLQRLDAALGLGQCRLVRSPPLGQGLNLGRGRGQGSLDLCQLLAVRLALRLCLGLGLRQLGAVRRLDLGQLVPVALAALLGLGPGLAQLGLGILQPLLEEVPLRDQGGLRLGRGLHLRLESGDLHRRRLRGLSGLAQLGLKPLDLGRLLGGLLGHLLHPELDLRQLDPGGVRRLPLQPQGLCLALDLLGTLRRRGGRLVPLRGQGLGPGHGLGQLGLQCGPGCGQLHRLGLCLDQSPLHLGPRPSGGPLYLLRQREDQLARQLRGLRLRLGPCGPPHLHVCVDRVRGAGAERFAHGPDGRGLAVGHHLVSYRRHLLVCDPFSCHVALRVSYCILYHVSRINTDTLYDMIRYVKKNIAPA